jgi:hypothetical protein
VASLINLSAVVDDVCCNVQSTQPRTNHQNGTHTITGRNSTVSAAIGFMQPSLVSVVVVVVIQWIFRAVYQPINRG